jgi:hypothetical protein
MQMRIWAILGVFAMLATSSACSKKSDSPGSDATSGAEKAAKDTGDKVDEAAEDVGDKVEEATE